MSDGNVRALPLPARRRYPDPDGPLRGRVGALDVVRGFALCGILVANVQPIANAGQVVVTGPPAATDAGRMWLGLLVEHRFFPIFSLLFGIGFSLLLESAATRTERPRLVLLRRLLVLLGMGLAHMLLWRGDILGFYALAGLIVMLPSTWLPRRAVAVLGAVLLAAAVVIGGDPRLLVPGLFLVGSALVRYGVIDNLGRSSPGSTLGSTLGSTSATAKLGLIFAALAVPAAWAQVALAGSEPAGPLASLFGLAGLLTAGAYVCALLVLLRTPLRPALRVLFTPLGRMALTNYLTATVLVLALAPAVGGRPENWSTATVCLTAAGVLTLQWVFSTLWLRRFRYGPLEWLWRWATWARRPPLRHLPKQGPPRLLATHPNHRPTPAISAALTAAPDPPAVHAAAGDPTAPAAPAAATAPDAPAAQAAAGGPAASVGTSAPSAPAASATPAAPVAPAGPVARGQRAGHGHGVAAPT